jgi:hypothetical protein
VRLLISVGAVVTRSVTVVLVLVHLASVLRSRCKILPKIIVHSNQVIKKPRIETIVIGDTQPEIIEIPDTQPPTIVIPDTQPQIIEILDTQPIKTIEIVLVLDNLVYLVFALLLPVSKNSSLLRNLLLNKRPPPHNCYSFPHC